MALTLTTLASATYITTLATSGAVIVNFAPAEEAVVVDGRLTVSSKVRTPGVFGMGQSPEGQASQPEI